MAGAVIRVEGSEQSTKTLHLYAMVGKLSGLFCAKVESDSIGPRPLVVKLSDLLLQKVVMKEIKNVRSARARLCIYIYIYMYVCVQVLCVYVWLDECNGKCSFEKDNLRL